MLPKLYSKPNEVNNDLRLLGRHYQPPLVPVVPPPPPTTKNSGHDKHHLRPHKVHKAIHHHHQHQHQQQQQTTTPPHLFLHFDVNETILIGDPAGGDSVEECLNKIIAKSAFVSTSSITNVDGVDDVDNDDDDDDDGMDNNNNNNNNKHHHQDVSSTHNLKPTHWWNGSPLELDSTTTNKDNNDGSSECNNTNNNINNNSTPPPPPLYTGWKWPSQSCPYYRTCYKSHSKTFTEESSSSHGTMYRPLYEHLCDKLGILSDHTLDENGVEQQEEEEEDDTIKFEFNHFLPAFFNTLEYYFPSSTSTTTTTTTTTKTTFDNGNFNDNNNNDNDHASNQNLPPRPSKVTLVLRTFGTDLPRVAQCISEFAKGNHPSYPNYYNENLILEERDLLRSSWTMATTTATTTTTKTTTTHDGNSNKNNNNNNNQDEYNDDKKKEWIYELHSSSSTLKSDDDDNNNKKKSTIISGDENVLDYLQSKTIVGIQDCYPFWRDNEWAPWAGKPVWARSAVGSVVGSVDGSRSRRSSNAGAGAGVTTRYNHHHILLDDNIHNDPNDGAGGIRIPIITDTGDDDDERAMLATTTAKGTSASSSYEPLHGKEALEMHGKHLIRVPTIRPLLEDDWFVRQIEDARTRVFDEETGGRYEKSLDAALVLSNRNLSETDFPRDDMPPSLNLRSIDLSRNRLKCIPNQMLSFSMLTSLDVSRNSLQGIPPEIRHLTNLVELVALSNHLRMRQLPLDDLASLENLRLLDVRYNRKLKQAALDSLREALVVRPNNPHLEIRCTIPPPASSSSSSQHHHHHANSDKKLSACDRDATLLQSQLEPLSTPQLCKRLERSFGVFLNKETEQAYDRNFVMKTLLQHYEEHHGGSPRRQVRYERGGALVSPGRLAALRAELDAVPWPNTTRERPKIRAERYMILQKPGSGKAGSVRTKKETAKLARYERLFELAVEAVGEVDPAFAEAFTALAVTKNFVGSPHIDTLNVGPFYGLSLGEFTGGGAIAVECSPFQVAEVDTRGKFGKVDGRFPHWVTPYEGTRYSLIYYVTSGIVEPQTTAIFAPPPPSPNATEKSAAAWVPPPSFEP